MPVDPTPAVKRHLETFSERRKAAIERLSLHQLLAKKNPYLFIARNVNTPAELAHELVTAALSSSEETMFGETLEHIAIDLCAAAYGGRKSTATGIDLEFDRDERHHVVAIKSGPNWGNSSQVAKMRQDFANTAKLIRQHDPLANVHAVNGCCYGSGIFDRGSYVKVCGAAFWELVTGDSLIYRRIIRPLREAASNGFLAERQALVYRISAELGAQWCRPDGNIDWAKVVDRSANLKPKR